MKFLEKLWSALGLYEYVEVNDDDEDKIEGDNLENSENISAFNEQSTFSNRIQSAQDRIPKGEKFFSKKQQKTAPVNNIVKLPTSNDQIKVMVVKPTSFDDAQSIADHICTAKPVVVNFEETDPIIMKRIIDFISGTVYALNGNIQLVGSSIMLCAPKNVDLDINSDFISGQDFDPWRQ